MRHPVLELVPGRISRILNPKDEKKLFQMKEVAGLSLPHINPSTTSSYSNFLDIPIFTM
jgi:hypothetical protein